MIPVVPNNRHACWNSLFFLSNERNISGEKVIPCWPGNVPVTPVLVEDIQAKRKESKRDKESKGHCICDKAKRSYSHSRSFDETDDQDQASEAEKRDPGNEVAISVLSLAKLKNHMPRHASSARAK